MHRCLDFFFMGVLPQNAVKFRQLLGLALFLNSLLFSGRAASTHDSSSFAPSKWDREMRLSLVVNLFTAAVRFQCDIKLLITAEQTALYKYSLSMLPAIQLLSRGSGAEGNVTGLTRSPISRGLTWLFKKPASLGERVPGIYTLYTRLHFILHSALLSKCRSDFLG